MSRHYISISENIPLFLSESDLQNSRITGMVQESDSRLQGQGYA